MSGLAPIKLHCRGASTDFLNVQPETDEPTVLAFAIHEEAERCTALISEDDARKLFNWLGVWLHTPR